MASWTKPAVLGNLKGLKGLGLPPFALSPGSRKRFCSAQPSSESWGTTRSACSTCRPASTKVAKAARSSVIRSSLESSSFSGGEGIVPQRAVFTSVEGGRSLGRRKNEIAASSMQEEGSASSQLEDTLFGPAESVALSAQSVVQGFAEPFGGDFSMDMTGTVGAMSSNSEFEAIAVSVPMYQPKWIWFAESAEQENMIIDRTINAVIVGSAATIALTKVLTVDHDYWHGWTLFEILEYAPVHNWFAYEELLKTHPVLAKMMISGTVYSLGDWIAQCYEGKPALDFNRLRMLRSGLVGFCLHGSLSHFYYHFCEWLFPFQGWWVLPLKVGFDQTIWSGFWNSIYFTTVGLLRMDSPVAIFKELRQTFFPLLTAGWKLWPFAHLVTYGVIPVEQRLLWVDMVEIVWVTILAMYSNEKAEARIAEAENSQQVVEKACEAVTAAQEGIEDDTKA